jgi:F0F1-type ATP synthase assembly protein I
MPHLTAVIFSPAVNSDRRSKVPVKGRGDDFVWSLVGTLVGGPIAWGAIGWGADALLGTTRIFLPIGVVLGFITSAVVVYWRFGRD